MTCKHCDCGFEKEMVDEMIAEVKETFDESYTDEWCRQFIRAALTDTLKHYQQVSCDECDLQVDNACVATKCPNL